MVALPVLATLPRRPRVRGDCLPGGCNEQRPCPWVSCRYHLALEVTSAGSLKVPGVVVQCGDGRQDSRPIQRSRSSHERRGPGELAEVEERVLAHLESGRPSCALDVADEGEHTLDETGVATGVTRERARQVEAEAVRKARKSVALEESAVESFSCLAQRDGGWPVPDLDHGDWVAFSRGVERAWRRMGLDKKHPYRNYQSHRKRKNK